MSQLTTRRLRWAAAAPLAALTLFSVAACGSSTASSAAGTHSGHPRSAAMQAYTQCLSSHGVTLPARTHGAAPADGTAPADPATTGAGAPAQQGAGRHHDMATPPPGVSQASWDAARSACASLAPSHASTGAAPSTAGS
ncbi:MAG TPA: hypothetical protein VH008_22445 [Pseudonocardia sp.]|jgi:hypothetical protein|nr:hypothetical protein [Pseudonocardia sp.]